MPASLSADGRMWACCRFCGMGIWRYPNGTMWRGADNTSTCEHSKVNYHLPEY